MESKVNYTLVGIFVIVLTAAIIFSIIWLSAGFSTKNYIVYKVLMTESVNGLSVDSPVRYSGVDVGKVKHMRLCREDPTHVELLLNIEEGTPVNMSTVATLATQGITGVAFIDLQTKGTDTRPLLAQPGHKYPLIPSSPSLFFRLDKAINEITNDFNKIAYSISAVLDVENRHSIKQTLSNLDKITTDLAGQSKQIKSIIQNTDQATKKLPKLFQEGQTAVKTINNQTLPRFNEILNGAQGITNNFLDTSQTIKQNPAVLLRGQEPRALGPGEQ